MRHWRDLLLLAARMDVFADELTPRVSVAPENNCAILVGRVSENLVQLHSKSVEVADVEWAEIAMERIV